MSDDFREIANYELPYSRKAELREVSFEGGMKMLRLILRDLLMKHTPSTCSEGIGLSEYQAPLAGIFPGA